MAHSSRVREKHTEQDTDKLRRPAQNTLCIFRAQCARLPPDSSNAASLCRKTTETGLLELRSVGQVEQSLADVERSAFV